MTTRPPLSSAFNATLFGLVGAMVGILIQSISGVPDYGSRFPPGPFVLAAIAGVIWLGSRLWWTPLIGAGVCLLITIGAFVRPGTGGRLSHPGEIAAFTGTLLQMASLVTGLVGGVIATVQNYRKLAVKSTVAQGICMVLGSLFLVIGFVVIARGAPVNKYHNALHMLTGAAALAVVFFGTRSAPRMFCIGFGAFYALFGLMGLLLGDRTMEYAWHLGPLHLNLGDHVFHLVLGPALLIVGLLAKKAPARKAPLPV